MWKYLGIGGLALALGCADEPMQEPFGLALEAADASVGYRISDLGTLGGRDATARAINDRGTVAGTARTGSGQWTVFVWNNRTGMVDIGLPPGASTALVAAINNREEIVGSAAFRGYSRAFYWSASRGFVLLNTLGGVGAQGSDINNLGLIVGRSQDLAGKWRAFSYRLDGTLMDLGALGGDEALADGVNDAGLIVGQARDASNSWRPAMWLPASGIAIVPPGCGWAADVNRYGVVMGGCGTTPFTWDVEGGFRDLGPFARAINTVPISISDAGLVAGNALTAAFTFLPFVVDRGRWTVLPGLPGAAAAWVEELNGCGWAVGRAPTAAGEVHAVLWRRRPPAGAPAPPAGVDQARCASLRPE